MKLEPVVRSTSPSYPPRQRGRLPKWSLLSSWTRNIAAATCAAGALWLGGCYGATPIGTPDEEESFIDQILEYHFDIDQPPLPDEPEVSPGAAPMPGFECGTAPGWGYRTAPGYFEGNLCGNVAALSDFEVVTEGTYQIEVTSSRELVILEITDQEGMVVATLGPESGPVSLELPAGIWGMAATPAFPEDNPHAWFSVTVEFSE